MNLNNRQLEAVEHGTSPLLILAGAGTGKTTTILHRIEYLVKKELVRPDKVLALTFSVEAVENLKNRLISRDISDCELMTISTFHSFAKNIIEEHYIKLGYPSVPDVVDRDSLVYLLLKNIDSLSYFKSRRYNRFPSKAIKSLLSIHDQFCQELFLEEDFNNIEKYCLKNILDSQNEEDEVYRQILDSLNTFKDFKNIKKKSSFIEYEDMIYDFWMLINKDSNVLQSLKEKYDFIIIDEFQDNNFAFSEIINKISSNQNITVVGDDDQSIYSFRGANSYNMHGFHDLYSKDKNYKKIELVTNYRSGQKILDVANSIIVNNNNRLDKEFLVAEPREYADQNLVELCIGDFNAQISDIITQINFLLNKKDDKKIAILCRTHFDCETIAQALNENNIAHNYRNDKLFEQKTIKDVVAFLNFLISSKYSLHALIRLGRDRFSRNFIQNIIKLDKNSKNLLNSCIDNKGLFSPEEYHWLIGARSLIDSNFSNIILVDSIVRFLFKGSDLSKCDIYLLDIFKNIVLRFSNLYKKDDFRSLCEYINLIFDNNNIILEPQNPIQRQAVNLMTVHNSKGMEFDYVFLPFLQSSKFPQANKNPEFISSLPFSFKKWKMEDIDKKTYHIEEERRLFYVAVTRAREKLYLLTTPQRQSKFIKEIDLKSIFSVREIKSDSFFKIKKHDYFERWDSEFSNFLNLSASKIDLYNKCQLSYKYSNLDLIPSFKYNSFFALGNVVHKVLQEFHEKQIKTDDDITSLLDYFWNDRLYMYDCESHQYYEDAKEMLNNYLSYIENQNPSPILFEHFFKINMKSYVLSGVIDRLDIDSKGNLIIYDYKTSRSQKTKTQIKKSFQMPIYALALYSNGTLMHEKIPKNISSIYAAELSVRFPDLERMVNFTEEEILEIDKSINQLAKQMSSNVFKANPNFMNCNYCDYKKFVCSYYN